MSNPFRDLRSSQEVVSAIGERIPKVYFVGGCVRDQLLGIVSNDIDLEVYGVSAENLEILLNDLFPGQVHVVGKTFGVFRIPSSDGYVDVALPRRESKTGKGHSDFAVQGDPTMSIEDALRRRDFTINAMMQDVHGGAIIDPYGGAKDLAEKRLRVVDPKTFGDDPLRVYRAIQFAARFDLEIESQSFQLMQEMVASGDLEALSKERVTDELRKLFLNAERPSKGFELLNTLGIIDRDYPELAALRGTEQEQEWHPEGDVWIHTLMCLDEAARIIRTSNTSQEDAIAIMLGTLCHDLGKPSTTRVIDGRIRSRGHEEAGVHPATTLLARWSFSNEACEAAYVAAAEHLKPAMLYKDREKGTLSQSQYENAVRRLIRRIAPVDWRVLLAVAEADWAGRGDASRADGPYLYGAAFEDAVRALEARSDLDPILYGRDLLVLGIQSGPRVGEMLRMIEEARDKGEVQTREDAIRFAKERL